MQLEKKQKFNLLALMIIAFVVAFSINPLLGGLVIILLVLFLRKNSKHLRSFFLNYLQKASNLSNKLDNKPAFSAKKLLIKPVPLLHMPAVHPAQEKRGLVKRKKYLHIALNSTLEEAGEIIAQLPVSDRILIEAGTPLIKIYGTEAVVRIKAMAPGAYIVADTKCADLAEREVRMMAEAGANAVTCLGVAPIETIDSFIEECQKYRVDSMLDMMNVENALSVLKKLKKLPKVVILHRGVDETKFSKDKQIPYYQIKQIKGSYNLLTAVAGGDTIREVKRAILNDADIVVVWKNFYQPSSETAKLVKLFLKEIK